MCSVSLSIIVPVFNEGTYLAEHFVNFHSLETETTELIFVDGGSSDDTVSILKKADFRVMHSNKGRACQMNAGAESAAGEHLLFLHTDTILPTSIDDLVSLLGNITWGFFRVQLSHPGRVYRMISRGINLRSRLFSVATGDQGIIVETSLFLALGGYKNIVLMEDIELSRRLRKIKRPVILPIVLTVSSRRWESCGPIKMAMLMWCIQLAFKVGVSPGRLKSWYNG